jgi:hypothetical protein
MSPHYWIDAVLAGLGVVVFITGIVLYMIQGWQRVQIAPSRYWPSVVGTITASALEKSEGDRHYCAAVHYSYRVGAKNYECDRLFWGPNEGTEQQMADIVAAYPAGRDVWVQHDPKNPANAILEPGRNTGLTSATHYYALVLMGLGTLAVGGGLYALSH